MSAEFTKPKDRSPTSHLFLGNCGPAVGVSSKTIEEVLQQFGKVTVSIPDALLARVYVSFENSDSARKAAEFLRQPVPALDNRPLAVKFAALKRSEVEQEEGQEGTVSTDPQKLDITGLSLLQDFITPEAEKALVEELAHGEWEELARRRVQHFGYKFHYETRNVDPDSPTVPMPAKLDPILQRLQEVLNGWNPDQLTVNDYAPGVGLSPHIDTHSAFTGPIVSLSLVGPSAMEFRRHGRRQGVALPPRSLLVMDSEARLAWAHYIPHRKSDFVEGLGWVPRTRRISLTFRQVRRGPCRCPYPECCDSQACRLPPTRKAVAAHGSQTAAATAVMWADRTAGTSQQGALDLNGHHDTVQMCTSARPGAAAAPSADRGADSAGASHLEAAYVHQVYDAIAPHFSSTRFAVWPKVREFINSLSAGSVVADVGCGNGKYFGVRSDIAVLGSDRSPGLAQVAAQRLSSISGTAACTRADVAVADGLHLPYRAGSLDAVLCIAVMHHLSTERRRVELLEELARVLRPDGRALVTVWATQQEEPHKVAKWQAIGNQPSHCAVPTEVPVERPASQARQVPSDPGPPSAEYAADCVRSEWAVNSTPANDYFVPWHLPFHRAEASLAAALATEATDQPRASGESRPVLDRSKGTVVFKRYYHLFEAPELRALVQQIAGVRVLDVFYDKSNWCVVFDKSASI